jgi:hypothetical protein
VRFYASEVLLALQYLHLQGYVYRWARAWALVTPAAPVAAHVADTMQPGAAEAPEVPRMAVWNFVGVVTQHLLCLVCSSCAQGPEAREHPAARVGARHVDRL